MTDLAKTSIMDLLLRSKDQIKAALPKHLNSDRLVRISLTELRKNPKLNLCHPASVMAGILQASQLGLEIGSGLGQAYLVPFKRECQLIIGYQGMIDIAYRSGKLKDLRAYIVSKNDQFGFSVNQDGEKLEFIPNWENGIDEVTPENTLCVLAQATLTTGGTISKIVTTAEIEKTRKNAKAKDVWNQNWEAMALKTGIRRLYKMLPKSVEMNQIENVESNQGIIGREQQIDIMPAKLLDVVPAENTVDEEAYHEAMGKLMDLGGSAEAILGPQKYSAVNAKLKTDTVKEIYASIDILSTIIADAQK